MNSYISLNTRESEAVVVFVHDAVAGRNVEYGGDYAKELRSLNESIGRQGLSILKTNKGSRVYNSLEVECMRHLTRSGYKYTSTRIDIKNYSASIKIQSPIKLQGTQFISVEEQGNNCYVVKTINKADSCSAGLAILAKFTDFICTLPSVKQTASPNCVASPNGMSIGTSNIFNGSCS